MPRRNAKARKVHKGRSSAAGKWALVLLDPEHYRVEGAKRFKLRKKEPSDKAA